MLSAYFSFSQNQKDTIVFDRKLEEVTISATKTAKSIAKLPIPVMIISEKEIEEFGSSKLFDVIKNANQNNNTLHTVHYNSVSLDDLREDVVMESSSLEKEIIIENFPKEKNGFLVVAKVIED